jgi:hypothetical protein
MTNPESAILPVPPTTPPVSETREGSGLVVVPPERRAGLAAWALVLGLLLVWFGVVPELIRSSGDAPVSDDRTMEGLAAADTPSRKAVVHGLGTQTGHPADD